MAQHLQKWGPHGPHPKQENNFFAEITKPNHITSFQKKFILLKYHMFWLSYECFSILYDAFCSVLESVIWITSIFETSIFE